MKKITIFTPTYNRGYILPNLYHSLTEQNNKNFIWLIVDDGSIDQTERLVAQWISEHKVNIEYYKQSNQGKSMAHNKGVALTKTELFTCVDSDDYLSKEAIESVLLLWETKKSEIITGILAYKGYSNEKFVTDIKDKTCEKTTLKNAYACHGLVGDTMLIFKTDVISKFEFPHFLGEKFVPEAYLYDQIDQQGELLILKKTLYYCQYLEDGYTKNMAKLLLNNPNGYLAYIRQRLKFDENLKEKFLDSIRYIAMSIAAGEKNVIEKAVYPLFAMLTYPMGILFYFYRYRGIK
jgi:glycosyltransferase involved in cell wall biosynthesis